MFIISCKRQLRQKSVMDTMNCQMNEYLPPQNNGKYNIHIKQLSNPQIVHVLETTL